MRKVLLGCAAILTSATCYGSLSEAFAQTASSSLSPGQVTVQLNGRVNWYAGVEASTLDNNSATGEKTSTTSFLGYLRLYPGFDGVAANGLHYGAAAEIRTNTSSTATGETLYVYQAYGYLGLPRLGQISFGQQNGPTTIFETGTFEGFNDGGWNGDIEGLIPIAANPVYPFPDTAGNDQASDKIVYLSPNFSGLQLGISFTPNQSAENAGPVVTSSPTPIVGGMPRNLIEIGGQYTKTFGAVGVQIGAEYTTSGQVSYTGGATTLPTNYHDLNMVSGGATLTIAGLTFGGSSYYGSYNLSDGDNLGLEPNGGSNAIAWMLGAQYSNGPLVVGASFFVQL